MSMINELQWKSFGLIAVKYQSRAKRMKKKDDGFITLNTYTLAHLRRSQEFAKSCLSKKKLKMKHRGCYSRVKGEATTK